jgi:hypothetical protein
LSAAVDGVDPSTLDKAIELCVCVDEVEPPVVRVSLRELLAFGGERPLKLTLHLREGQRLRLRFGCTQRCFAGGGAPGGRNGLADAASEVSLICSTATLKLSRAGSTVRKVVADVP